MKVTRMFLGTTQAVAALYGELHDLVHVHAGQPGKPVQQDAERSQALSLRDRQWQRAGHLGAQTHTLLV